MAKHKRPSKAEADANVKAPLDPAIYVEVARRMHAIIEERAKAQGVTSDDYLRGVLKGTYPPVCLHDIDTSDLGVKINLTPNAGS